MLPSSVQIVCLLLVAEVFRIQAFTIFSLTRSCLPSTVLRPRRPSPCPPSYRRASSVVDVDFERIDDTRPPVADNPVDNNRNNNNELWDITQQGRRSLLDLSLEADDGSDWKWNNTRIPFIDGGGENYIDAKLAFMATLDNVRYGIAIPFDAAVALTIEDSNKDGGSIDYVSPDDDDDNDENNQELLEIMAGQLQEHVGDDLQLKKTPRILTIAGPLFKYTSNWTNDLVPPSYNAQQLLDDSDESLDFFHDFMKRELGEIEYEKTLKESTSPDNVALSGEILSLFHMPVLDDADNDDELQALLQTMMKSSPEEQLADMEETVSQGLHHQGVALKLLSYRLDDGKTYSLVKLLEPYTLVARYMDGNPNDIHFELLSREEAKVIIPRLEDVCQEALAAANLRLQQ